jgi:hypothetical protein
LKYIYYTSLIFFLYSSAVIAQTVEYKTHLFLGTWVGETKNDKTTEIWDINENGELRGIMLYENA